MVGLTEHTELRHLRDVLFKILRRSRVINQQEPLMTGGAVSQSLPAFLIFLHFHCVVFIKEDSRDFMLPHGHKIFKYHENMNRNCTGRVFLLE